MMKKIYKENQLLKINNIPSEVIESIKVKIDIMNENYEADRDIESDLGFKLQGRYLVKFSFILLILLNSIPIIIKVII